MTVEGEGFYTPDSQAKGPGMPSDQLYEELLDEGIPQPTLKTVNIPQYFDRFSGSPIAAMFADVAEGETPSIVHIRDHIYTSLTYPRQRIMVDKGRAFRREVVINGDEPDVIDLLLYMEYEYDPQFGPEIAKATAPIHAIMKSLVPDMLLTRRQGLVIHLTPTVRDNRKLLLHELREQRFLACSGEAVHVLARTDEQYRVFEQDDTGAYQERGILPFRDVSEYTDDPDLLDEEMRKPYYDVLHTLHGEASGMVFLGEEYDELSARITDLRNKLGILRPEPLRSETIIPTVPYATATFNPGTPSPAYKTKFVREVHAPLPPQFANLTTIHPDYW